ncbi:MAG TPA: NADP-dependent oxidoreductase [Actinocrinis sp.]|uniref:NADP-dependent oxidoreductase n=1 Tax=Actinocrinis sp. TaxID=1920516 RepID=UPI002D643D2A|nr:NADP-dependent oxidoreductase [Actinocrinis sp.]HZU56429.1 NADP-dependent oxidoreductase [Actinocrinis sp.]
MTDETIPATGLEVRLRAHPGDQVRADDFEVVEIPIAEPGDNEVLVRNEWMALGAVYRDQLDPDTDLPIPTFQVGQPLWGRTVGTVLRSNSPLLAPGDLVEHFFGWREYALGPAQAFFKRDRDLLPAPEYFLSQGPTAWRGVVDIADVHDGDVVFVSGATSGVGALAGQLAKVRGAALVIGSTGSPDKVDYLKSLGFDAVFDYHDGPVAQRLAALAPDGISVFFDNVGGEQFEAALTVAAHGARFALCGALAGQFGRGDGGRPRLDLMRAFPKEPVLRPFATLHTPDQIEDWNRRFAELLAQGALVYPHTVFEGSVAGLPESFLGLLAGRSRGTAVARLVAPERG